jgi:hypothetical protein
VRCELNVNDSSSKRICYNVQVLKRTDEKSTSVILKVDWDSDC